MDTFVCSSWYYLRYPNASYEGGPFDPEGLKWLPVDTYIGGAEHATMHLLYARFVTKALRDFGYLDFDEPFLKLYHQGTITKDGSKMSKSRGNTVSPDNFINKYGSDTFRAYLMFMGPFDEGGDWNDKGITGIDRFIKKVWRFCQQDECSDELSKKDIQVLHQTIRSASEDLMQMKFNTAISRLMEFVNSYSNKKNISIEVKTTLALMLAPIAPHISEEIWSQLNNSNSIFEQNWPTYDEAKTKDDKLTIIIQVNGKLRGRIEAHDDIDKNDLLEQCKMLDNVKAYLLDKEVIKEIVVPRKLVNFVVK